MNPSGPFSFKAGSTLAAARGVTLATGTAQTVKYPAAYTEAPIGITQDTILDTNQAIGVLTEGPADLEFASTVTAGELVAIDSTGKGVKHTDTTAGSFVIGKLISPLIAITGTIGKVLIQPHFKSIP
mgnify:CR=1 FL=1